MSDELKTTAFPPGFGYIEQVGWEEDEEHGRRFVARVVFPNGVPSIKLGDVFRKRPVHIEVHNE